MSYDDIFKIDTISPSLSQSLRQLIALTAALATNPQLYVMENPETHLDMDSMSLLKGILIQEKQRGKTIILSTQSRSLLQLAEHMVLLNNGKTLFKGEQNEFETVKNTMTDQRGLQNMNAFYASNQPSMNEHAGVRQ